MWKKYSFDQELDELERTLAHREIIRSKTFLKNLYKNWYGIFIACANTTPKGKFLEIGSGGGFLKEVFPTVITSDIMALPQVDLIINAESLPFKDRDLGCIMMLNVFHHIPRPYLSLHEAERTLLPGGKIIMIEPANSALGRLIYKNFHHEPFLENGEREIDPGKPLGNSNQALPYIYFERDVDWFKTEFPTLEISNIKYHTPLLYLASGGLTRNALFPIVFYNVLKGIEWLLSPLNRYLGLFCTIILEKQLRDCD
jgi:SAM-dependent methyltransferase